MGNPRGWLVGVVCGWMLAVAVLTAVGIASPLVGGDFGGAPVAGSVGWVGGLIVITAQAMSLRWSPRHPPWILLAVAAAAPLAAPLLGPAQGCTSIAVMLAAFRATLGVDTSRTWVSLAGAATLVAAGQLLVLLDEGVAMPQAVVSSIVQGLATVGLAALVGVIVGTRQESRRARDDRDRAHLREQAALVEVAVARERTAMARELHDIAAHHLTGIAVMTGALTKQIDRDPAGAKRSVEQVRRQSTEMLRDMRGLVGLLRPTQEAEGSEPGTPRQHSFDGMEQLVEEAGAEGAPVELAVLAPLTVDPRDRVGPLAQLSAYRTVQEALSNAARHAPGRPARVQIDARAAHEVRVTISNEMSAHDPHPERGGFGLVGMSERAELTSSRLSYGPQQGHWVVELVVPVPDEPSERHEDESENEK